jgi:hypothetical protein
VLWAIFVLAVALPLVHPDWTYGRLLQPPVPSLFGELVVRPAICYLVTDFFRGAAAKHPSLAAGGNLPSGDTNRALLLGDAVAS